MDRTSVSLLERLRGPDEPAAWERFVRLYTPLLYQWAGRLGLQDADAADLVQDVFAVLVRKLPEFRYDPQKRFRGWLWTVLVNKWRERGRRRPAAGQPVGPEGLDELPGPDVEEGAIEAEYREYLIRRAMEVMRQEFQPATWQAFWECVVADRPAADVARQLGISENAVYLAKGRVLRRLRQELEGLLD
jgi:RNA polymerase sigma-70 factor (ECF subfamily)